MHTSKIRPIFEILNGCNSESIQVQGLKFRAKSSLRVRYVLTKFRQNLCRVSILRADLTWNDPIIVILSDMYVVFMDQRVSNSYHLGAVCT